MSAPKTIPHDPRTGPGKPGVGTEQAPARPGFRDPANKGSKAQKKQKPKK